MSYHREEFIRSRVKALSILIRGVEEDEDGHEINPLTEHALDRLIRMLRPTNHQIQDYAKAVKIRLRQSILNHPHINTVTGTTSNEGPLLLARFDKEVETFARMYPALIHSYLVLLKPLSFYEPPKRVLENQGRRVRKTLPTVVTGSVSQSQYTPASTLHSRQILSAEEKLQQQIHSSSSHNQLFNQRNGLNKGLYEDSASSSVRISITNPPPPVPHRSASTTTAPSGSSAKTSTTIPVDTSVTPNTTLNSQQVAMHWVNPDIERKLLIDLVYILQGVAGKHIKYDTRSESYVIDPILQVPSTVRDITLCICELGWLYNKVNDYLKRIFQTGGSSGSSSSIMITETKGLVVQAFGFALQEELHDYYRLLAILEQELLKDNAIATALSTAPTIDRDGRDRDFQSKQTMEGNVSNNSVGGNAGLTLLRLRAWMQEPIERMCLMARLVDGAGLLTGGALASRLHAHARHGDMSCSDLVQRIMDSVCNPIYSMLTRWILHGELHDPHGEFFVGVASNTTGSGPSASSTSGYVMKNIWKESYFLRSHLLPTFIPKPLAEKMIVIGKSINFIKLCLQRLPKAKRSLHAQVPTATGNTSRRSFRQINKAKKLTTYGRVVDTNALESKESITEDALDMMEGPSDGEDTVGGKSGQREKSVGKEKEKEKEKENNLNQEVESILRDIFFSSSSQSSGKSQRPSQHQQHQDVESMLKRLLRTTSLINYSTVISLNNNRSIVDQHQHHEQTDEKKSEESFELSEIIYKLSNAIDNSLLQLLYHSFSFMKHLQALKKFMLLGQGDFVTCLMDSIGPELKKRANQLFRHNLTSILEGALRASNAQYEDSFILDRVGVRLLEPVPGDSGWEIFSLDYQVDLPLNAVVNMDAMSKYRIAFHMLWRLKRVEWSLASTWKQFLTFAHCFEHRPSSQASKKGGAGTGVNLQGLSELKPVFHRCHLNRARMMHVINNLCAYLMFEVLETAWVHLETALKKATCLDDVIVAHDAYLNEILDRALLSSHHEVLNIQLQQLLQIILRFCHLEETLIADATAYITRQRLAVSAYQERAKYGDGDDNASVNSQSTMNNRPGSMRYSSYVPPSDGLPLMVISRIDETVKEYSAQFDKLMDMLKDESDKSGEFLRFLTFRLDFNDYHEKQRQRGKGVGITGTPKTTGTAPPLPLTYGAELDDGDDMTANFQPKRLNL